MKPTYFYIKLIQLNQLQSNLISYKKNYHGKKEELKQIIPEFPNREQTKNIQNSLKKIEIKKLKSASKAQINQLTKELANSKDKLTHLTELTSLIQDDKFINAMEEQFGSMDDIEKFIFEDLPKNTTVICPQQGPKHLLIEDEIQLYKQKTNIYTYHSHLIEDLVNKTSKIWNAYRIEEEFKIEVNSKEIISKARKSLNQFKENCGYDLLDCIPENSTLEQCIKRTLINYTGSHYKMINQASTSKNIMILKGIRYLFQILIKNFRNRIVGQPVDSKKELIRHVPIEKDLFNLYRLNQIIYFTNLTSASDQELTHFGTPKPGQVHVRFVIKLEYLEQQKKNKFFSGLKIDDISHFQGEVERLIFPFQFFKITKIQETKGKIYEIHLQELRSKKIIEMMEKPLVKPHKKFNPNKEVLKKKIKQNIEGCSKNLDKKTQEKQQLKAEYKKKLIEVYEHYGTKYINQSQNPETETIDSSLILGIIGMSLKKIDVQYIDALKDEKNQSSELNKIAENCQSINQLLQKHYKLNKGAPSKPQNQNFQNETIINNIINSVSQLEQEQSKKKVEELKEKSKLLQFADLKVNYCKQIQSKQYFMMVLNQTFKQSNQQTILKQSLPKCLYQYYIQRLTIYDKNNEYYHYYCTKTEDTNLEKISSEINQKFNLTYPSPEQYIKQVINVASYDKILIKIQSSKNYNQIYALIESIAKNNNISLLKGEKQVKHKYMVYCDEMLANKGNKNYIIQNFEPETRGGIAYYFPNNTLRVGLRVWGIYEDNQWLGMMNEPGSWPVVYTCFKQIVTKPELENSDNDNSVSNKKYQRISKNSIHCCAKFDELIKYMPSISINGQQLYVGFQCRVQPHQLQFSNNHPTFYFINRQKSKLIRPYGIILKKK